MLSLNDFQARCASTAVYPSRVGMEYTILGLVGEAGEVANAYKKILRGDFDSNPEKLAAKKNHIKEELGDVMWYIAMIAKEMEVDLETLAQGVLSKLEFRRENSQLKDR